MPNKSLFIKNLSSFSQSWSFILNFFGEHNTEYMIIIKGLLQIIHKLKEMKQIAEKLTAGRYIIVLDLSLSKV